MVSDSIRSYNRLPAEASDRLGLTAETCRGVTIFARHENVLTLFSKILICSPVFTVSRFLKEFPRKGTQSDFKHDTLFQSKTLSF